MLGRHPAQRCTAERPGIDHLSREHSRETTGNPTGRADRFWPLALFSVKMIRQCSWRLRTAPARPTPCHSRPRAIGARPSPASSPAWHRLARWSRADSHLRSVHPRRSGQSPSLPRSERRAGQTPCYTREVQHTAEGLIGTGFRQRLPFSQVDVVHFDETPPLVNSTIALPMASPTFM